MNEGSLRMVRGPSLVCAGLVCLILQTSAPAADPAATPAYRPPASVPKAGIGFLYDGTGVVPNSKPPTTWNEKTGENILWRVELPSWCDGSPVPVGNRVFVMNEPGLEGMVFPLLQCYDADSGALLWSRVVDPFEAFPDMEPELRKALTADVAWVQAIIRNLDRIIEEFLVVRNAAASYTTTGGWWTRRTIPSVRRNCPPTPSPRCGGSSRR